MLQKTQFISSKLFDIYVFLYLQTSTSFVFFNDFLEEWWTPICNLALFTTFSKGDNNVFTLYYFLFSSTLMTYNCDLRRHTNIWLTKFDIYNQKTNVLLLKKNMIPTRHTCYSCRKTRQNKARGSYYENNVLWTNRN